MIPIALLPDLVLAGTALLALVLELVLPERQRFAGIAGAAVLGLLASLVLVVLTAVDGQAGAWLARGWTAPLKATVLVAALGTVLMLPSHADEGNRRVRRLGTPGIAVFLLLVACLGAFVACAATDLLALLLGLELATIPLYCLVAAHYDRLSSEAAAKYLTVGGLGTGFAVFGISYLSGAAGSLSFDRLGPALADGGPFAAIGAIALVCALLFKIAAVPLHAWAPDVYHGAAAPVAGFLAAGSKATGLVVLLILLDGPLAPLRPQLVPLLLVAALASMVIGNLGALKQGQMRRFMAYSSIAQAGFFLLAVAAGAGGTAAIGFYAVVYALSNFVAFVVFDCVCEGRPADLASLRGLSKQHPLLALCLLLAMFSLAGVPPLAGFFGKFALLLAAAQQHWWALVLAAALNAVVSLYYYLMVVRAAYIDPPVGEPPPLRLDRGQRFGLAVATPLLVVLGIWPGVHDWAVGLATSSDAVAGADAAARIEVPHDPHRSPGSSAPGLADHH